MNKSQKITAKIIIFIQSALAVFFLTTNIAAQISSVDASFNPFVIGSSGGLSAFTVQPDGKILSYGYFQLVNGVVKNNLVRINPDGTLDNTFDCTVCDFSVASTLVQPDGKIIVSGALNSSNNTGSAAQIKRLNTDGSLDTSFVPFGNAPLSPQVFLADVRAIQPDGKILVVLINSGPNSLSYNLNRLNPNGSFDTTFTPINVGGGRNIVTSPGKIDVLPNGKILVASTTSSNGVSSSLLKRYNADGTPDDTFNSPTYAGTRGSSENGYNISDFAVLADGSIVVVGDFNSVNSIVRTNIVKLLPDGNVDLTFARTNVFQTGETGYQIAVYPNSKILISTLSANAPTNRFIRLNADGSLDNSFTSPATPLLIYRFYIDGANNVLFLANFMENGVTNYKYGRLNENGNLVSTFTVDFARGGFVEALAVQADNKVIVAGNFERVGQVPRQNIARLNSDGTLDQTFNAGAGFNGVAAKIIVQPNGKILVGGSFPIFDGTESGALVRLNSDGSLDPSFDAKINSLIYSMTLQSDGRILIGGEILDIAGQQRTGIVRLNPDGSLDPSFNPLLLGDNTNPSQYITPTIRSVIAQTDGKIVIGGIFSSVNGVNRPNLARLNTDGTLDTSFNAGFIAPVSLVKSYPNGRYLVLSGNTLFRLNSDGTPDNTFQNLSLNSGNLVYLGINAIAVQPDGSIIIGGEFTNIRGIARSNLARLRANGTLDTGFFPVGARGDVVTTIINQSNDKILIGGNFIMVENIIRLGVARLNIVPVRTVNTMFDFDGDGRADISVFRPSNGFWYQIRSQNNAFNNFQFGQSTDKLAPADYDGDGKTDIAVFRDNVPGAGDKAYFYVTKSSDNSFRTVQFGTQNDLPVSGDWDGDGIADLAVYRGAKSVGGQSYFYYRPSSNSNVDFRTIQWGTFGDKPLTGDFDGDGKLDAAVFRPSNGTWYILNSSNAQIIQQSFGAATDIPTPADFDNDGKTNIAVFRPSNGTWYITRPTGTTTLSFDSTQFGTANDKPVPADYDGDGRADIAVFRPSNGTWYVLRSMAGFTGVQFGAAGDQPIPNVFIR